RTSFFFSLHCKHIKFASQGYIEKCIHKSQENCTHGLAEPPARSNETSCCARARKLQGWAGRTSHARGEMGSC
uniref:Uncharacterized protein n=1 Tax=Triticum urartu TaxID=4572 RepID=A0A8R7U576_TRIUA